jgi:hypothetical protein
MTRKLSTVVAFALATVILLAGIGPIAAAESLGSGPDAALAPGNGWTPLAVGQQIWYDFNYTGDGSQVLVDLAVSPNNAARFAVWTPATLATRAAGNVPKPVGVGSSDSYVNGDLVWTGAFNEPGTYYIVVDQTGPVAGGVLLTVIGSGVSARTPPPTTAVPAPTATAPIATVVSASLINVAAQVTARPLPATVAPAATVAPVATPTVPPGGTRTSFRQPSARDVPGSGPDTALAPGIGWAPLAVGQRIWYAFNYMGDNSQVVVDLAVSPNNAANFAVWTPATLATWAAGNVPDPVGAGSIDNYMNGDLVWSGKFNQPGTYYVVVNQAGTAVGGTLLKVTGSGVSTGSRAGGQSGGR